MKTLVSLQFAYRSVLFKNAEVPGQTEAGAEYYDDVMKVTHDQLKAEMETYSEGDIDLKKPDFSRYKQTAERLVHAPSLGSKGAIDVYPRLHTPNMKEVTFQLHQTTGMAHIANLQHMLKQSPPYTHIVVENSHEHNPAKLRAQLLATGDAFFKITSFTKQQIINGKYNIGTYMQANAQLRGTLARFGEAAIYLALHPDVQIVSEGSAGQIAQNMATTKTITTPSARDAYYNKREQNVTDQCNNVLKANPSARIAVPFGAMHNWDDNGALVQTGGAPQPAVRVKEPQLALKEGAWELFRINMEGFDVQLQAYSTQNNVPLESVLMGLPKKNFANIQGILKLHPEFVKSMPEMYQRAFANHF